MRSTIDVCAWHDPLLLPTGGTVASSNSAVVRSRYRQVGPQIGLGSCSLCNNVHATSLGLVQRARSLMANVRRPPRSSFASLSTTTDYCVAHARVTLPFPSRTQSLTYCPDWSWLYGWTIRLGPSIYSPRSSSVRSRNSRLKFLRLSESGFGLQAPKERLDMCAKPSLRVYGLRNSAQGDDFAAQADDDDNAVAGHATSAETAPRSELGEICCRHQNAEERTAESTGSGGWQGGGWKGWMVR